MAVAPPVGATSETACPGVGLPNWSAARTVTAAKAVPTAAAWLAPAVTATVATEPGRLVRGTGTENPPAAAVTAYIPATVLAVGVNWAKP